MIKRLFSMFVVLMMLLGVTAFTPVAAEETASEILLGTDVLQKKAIVWFGSNESLEALASGWRVLKVEEDGSLLVLLNEVFSGGEFNTVSSRFNIWEGSAAQNWCRNFYEIWPFALEKEMILPTTISESGNYDRTIAVSINDEYLYLLSKREIVEGGLFDSTEDRVAYEAGTNSSEIRWWTRSGSSGDRLFTAWVREDGNVDNFQIDNWAGYRPAFHLSLKNVLFVSSAFNGKADSTALSPLAANEDNNWKLTILDEKRGFEADASDLAANQGGVIAIPYDKAETGEGEYISVLVVKKNRAAEEAVAYASIPVKSVEGTAEFSVPVDMEAGEYVLKVFNEQKNGDKLSDFASAFTEISLTVSHVHEWTEPEYVWSDDNSEITATRVCKLNPDHVETETKKTTSEVTVQPDCENHGETTYTVVFENPAFEKQVKKLDEPDALGHDLTFVDAKDPTDTEDGNIAYYVCNRCGKFFEDADAEVEIEDHASVIIPALNPVPETGDNDDVIKLAVVMMAVSVAASGLYLNAKRQRREANQ